MRKHAPALALALAVGAFGLSVAHAQQAAPPAAAAPGPAFKNLQFFPKDISKPELLGNMRFFTQALGVRCTYCHVGTEGQPPSTYDFASDAKKEKLIARKMLAMVRRINTQDFGVQPSLGQAKVTCFTCHRGAQHPLQAPPAAATIERPSSASPAASPR